jgi:L(+)-tartrate dehydratase beta subunit
MPHTHRLQTPLSETTARKLVAGDEVYLSGVIFGMRDATHRFIVENGHESPVDLRGAVILHTAPNVKRLKNEYVKLSIGPTTSLRMEKYTPTLIKKYGVRGIVGKGGMGKLSLDAMVSGGAVYMAAVGGAAALYTSKVLKIEEVFFEELYPECLWKLRVKEFGPLTVAMDTRGSNIYAEIQMGAKGKLDSIMSETLRSSLV